MIDDVLMKCSTTLRTRSRDIELDLVQYPYRKKSNAVLHRGMSEHALSSIACDPQSRVPTRLDSLVSDILLAVREGRDNHVPLTSCFVVDCCRLFLVTLISASLWELFGLSDPNAVATTTE